MPSADACTGKNDAEISGKFCIFLKIFHFFFSKWANYSSILRGKNGIFFRKIQKNPHDLSQCDGGVIKLLPLMPTVWNNFDCINA